jgi:CheY-like chemotaxis protein
MTRIFYVHWNKDEAMETVRTLREAGHAVVLHHRIEEGAGADAWKSIKAKPPDALVISLERLPSHGRRIAAVTTESKKLRDVPVIFVGGEAEKVEVARQQFPAARFIGPAALVKTLAQPQPRGRQRAAKA